MTVDHPSEPHSTSWGSQTRSVRPIGDDGASARASSVSVLRSEVPGHTDTIQPGTTIGRYMVLEPLGEGAMGRVLRAYDPKLAREVAIKLVKAWVLDANAEERLAREARAMARLSHPNVVGIYDVEVEQHRVLIVMEYVSGTTMRHWLRQPRPWREVLDVCRQAGRGLAAAHAAGLVHRDFKPGNILIGTDGRARVTDFGLARIPGDPQLGDSIARSAGAQATGDVTHGDDSRLTRTGAVVGTPAYMAPEQHVSLEADERADQYAFCVTLWEGLFGERPFRDEGLERKSEGPPEPPRGRGIPRRVLEALRRGLAPDTAARWPSMRQLLDELDRAVTRRRRVWLTTAAATMVGALGLWVLTPGEQRCTGAERHLAEVWGPEQHDAVQAALQQTGVAYAKDAAALVDREFDAYQAQWVAMHTEACEATSVRGEQSTDVLDLRMECLNRARNEFEAAISVLSTADVKVAEQTRELVAGLPSLVHCADVEGLRTERPDSEDPEVAEALQGLRRRIAELAWMSRAGHYEQALLDIEPLELQAQAVGHQPLRAELRLLHGQLLARQAQPVQAEAALREALEIGLEHGARSVVIDAIVELLEVVGADQSRPAEAQWLASMGMGLALRWRLGDEAMAALHHGRGLVLSAQGDLGGAENEHRRALELLLREHGELHLDVLDARLSLASVLDEQSKHDQAETIHREVLAQYVSKLGPDHPEVARVHTLLGRALAQQGRYAEAEVEHRHALERLDAALGPDHPAVAQAANQLGTALYDQARYDEAEQAYLRALTIHESTPKGPRDPLMVDTVNNLAQIEWRRGHFELAESYTRKALAVAVDLHGSDHPDVGRQRNNLALVLKAQGRLDEAETELRRVLEIYRGALGPEHPRVATALLNLGNVLVLQGHDDEAVRDYELARDVYEAALGPDHPKLATVLYNLGVLYLQRSDHAMAEASCRRALAINEQTLGPEHPDVGLSLACLGQIALDQERHDDAVALYQHALDLGGEEAASGGRRPEMRFGLARAQWGAGQRTLARSLAREALRVYVEQDDRGPMREEIERWLATHAHGSG